MSTSSGKDPAPAQTPNGGLTPVSRSSANKPKRHRRIFNYRLGERFSGAAFLAPSFIGVSVFFIIPFCIVVNYSLIHDPFTNEFVGLDNYKQLIENSAFQTAAKNTMLFTAIAVPLAVILSLALACLLDTAIPGRSVFRSFFLSPMMVPVASIVLIWQVLFSNNGAVNDFLSRFGIEKIDWFKTSLSRVVVTLLFLWKNLGYNMILFMAALNNLPKEVLEAASVDGAGALRRFFGIKMRYLSSTLLFVTILSIINSFKIFREIYLLAGDYPIDELYMLQTFMNNTFKTSYQKLSSAAVLMAIVVASIIAVLFIAESRYGKDIEE